MTEQPSASDDAATPDAADGEPQDAKARFRAALDRKRQQQSHGVGGPHGDSKIAGTHGAAGGKRVFRRKSG